MTISPVSAASPSHAPPHARRRVGLMGGTFDPIHFGHLFLAEAARLHLDLERVIFFPNNVPAHATGKSASADGRTRLEMTRLAIADNPHFEVSDLELRREGKSFLIETLGEFERELGERTDLFFLMGADSLRDISTWHRASELFEKCRFVAANRPGVELGPALGALSDFQRSRVEVLEIPGLHIASSEIRQRIKNQTGARYLVPEAVLNVIQSRKLYGAP